ncbi:UDP-sugar pyrophosphorylase [Pelomyxa schiedti]|nr:UDP-sugar pyrophosphorylase [Pelomyxa schiedti]
MTSEIGAQGPDDNTKALPATAPTATTPTTTTATAAVTTTTAECNEGSAWEGPDPTWYDLNTGELCGGAASGGGDASGGGANGENEEELFLPERITRKMQAADCTWAAWSLVTPLLPEDARVTNTTAATHPEPEPEPVAQEQPPQDSQTNDGEEKLVNINEMAPSRPTPMQHLSATAVLGENKFCSFRNDAALLTLFPISVRTPMTKDGAVSRYILKANPSGTEVAANDRLCVRYEARIGQSGRVLDRSPKLSFCIGNGDVLAAWDGGMIGVRSGEQFLLWSTDEYAFGALGSPPRIPPKSSLIWEVEVLSVEKHIAPIITGKKTLEERIAQANIARTQGNEHFRKNAFRKALAAYNIGLSYFAGLHESDYSEDELSHMNECKLPLLLNCAACQLKSKHYPKVVESCKAALAIDPNNAKAYFRLSQAKSALGEVSAAYEALSKAKELAPNDKAIHTEFTEIAKKMRDQDKRHAFSGMFKRKDEIAWPAALEVNRSILTPEEIARCEWLVKEDQAQLFANWEPPGTNDDKKHKFFEQIKLLDTGYPQGLKQYIANAKKLLEQSRIGANPLEGYSANVPPNGKNLKYGDPEFIRYEEAGIPVVRKCVFVLVAGGLGERLGYAGIKLALTSESTTGACFLKQFITSILHLQRASNAAARALLPSTEFEGSDVPLVIMTSDDTHARTVQLLQQNNYFGMRQDKIFLLKQERVACVIDNFAHLAQPHNTEHGQYMIETKPHGHGDVHSLLYQSGLLQKFVQQGFQYLFFFQDTNGLFFHAVPSALGVSSVHNFHCNSVCVPRKAKEAIGAICELECKATGACMTACVEYNQLEPLLRAAGNSYGDFADPTTGYSWYPGNINQLVYALDPYLKVLESTKGEVPEFVNPKYRGSSRTDFISSVRLECIMQDFARAFPHGAPVGFTVMEQWLAFSPVKNSPEEAVKLVARGVPPASAASGEMAQYQATCLSLVNVGAKFIGADGRTLVSSPPAQITGLRKLPFRGLELDVWPNIVLSTNWAPTFTKMKEKVTTVSITDRSSLIIEGEGIQLKSLILDGALAIYACEGATVVIDGLEVRNQGWELVLTNSEDQARELSASPESESRFRRRIPHEDIWLRGFAIVPHETKELIFDTPGQYHVP